MANDGVYVAPRIVAATIQPQSAPQTISFHPVNERRVLSSFTAAEMRQMMQGVVLHGTGTKAKLIGYSSAGKTGTAQKVDPATHAYSHKKYVGSFAGFAPINNPAITVAVILDSAVGLHQGGQISAPVFQRITQQVLEYLHTPHDVEIPSNRQVLLARNKTSDKDKENDMEEGSPDHPGEAIDVADANPSDAAGVSSGSSNGVAVMPPVQSGGSPRAAIANAVVPAALRQKESIAPPTPALTSSPSTVANAVTPPGNATVVLDVEQGGIVVPSFVGKSVRSAIELAESSGLDLDVVGSGLAQEQSPAPGTHVNSGARIMVKFGR
jgi:cell division protein FtsI (penicillin-binding protein 3)